MLHNFNQKTTEFNISNRTNNPLLNENIGQKKNKKKNVESGI
jgi:hypothetical protein